MERISGTLGGRRGSFALQHSGTMRPTGVQLNLTVVPGTGAGELAGLEGEMTIRIVDGQHVYQFEYTLPAAR